jgi:hypothetical protein
VSNDSNYGVIKIPTICLAGNYGNNIDGDDFTIVIISVTSFHMTYHFLFFAVFPPYAFMA